MGIQLTAVACNNCGASLSIQEETRFVTCAHCGSQLAVHRTDGAAFTEQLAQIHTHTQQIADDVAALRRQIDLENLDKEWIQWKETFTGPSGRVPDPTASIIMGVAIGGFGIFAAAVVSAGPNPGQLPFWVGAILIGVGIAVGMYEHSRAIYYANAERIYKRKRSRLLSRDEVDASAIGWPQT